LALKKEILAGAPAEQVFPFLWVDFSQTIIKETLICLERSLLASFLLTLLKRKPSKVFWKVS